MSEFAPGDIVEVVTKNGLAYVQVTHNHPFYPEVIRGLPGIYESRPSDLVELAKQVTTFTAIIPLRSAIAKSALSGQKVSVSTVPAADSTFPTFKMTIRDKQGAIAYWWLWDGDGLRYDESPGEEINQMPPREVMTASCLLDRLGRLGGGRNVGRVIVGD